MKLLRLFGLGRSDPPQPPWDGPPDATPLHAWLDAAGFPWRTSRAELAARFGQGPDRAYGWPVIEIPTGPPLLDGLLRPLSAQAFPQISPRMPPASLFGHTHFGEDARENVRRTAGQLVDALGPVRPAVQYNTFKAEWRFGPALLRLTAWPRDPQTRSPEIAAEKVEPRLATACHIHIETGYRADPSAEERAWLESFHPIAPPQAPPAGGARVLRDATASEHGLEYVRRLPPGFEHLLGQTGLSGDGQAILFCRDQLYVVPMAQVLRLQLERLEPGRGPGGETLILECRTDGAAEPITTLGLASGRCGGDLEAASRPLAERLGLPLEVFDLGVDA